MKPNSVTGGMPLLMSIPVDEYHRMKSRIERLEVALREVTDPHLIMPFGNELWQKAEKARRLLESEDSE